MKLRLFILILTFICVVYLFAEEDSYNEKFLFVSVDTGYTIKGLLVGGIGVGAQVEVASFRYVGIAGNIGYFNAPYIFLNSYGGSLTFYPEGNGPYGYYIKVGCMYNIGQNTTNNVTQSGTLLTIPLQLGMKFVFDDLWGLTFDPYLEGEIYIGLDGYYEKVLTMYQSVGFRFGFTF
ncbi:MAG: hypothetical protein ACP5QT_04840 [Brevinematia bacterium]